MLMIAKILAVLAPDRCISCGTEGALLCEPCAGLLSPWPQQCIFCDALQALADQSAVCPSCCRRQPLSGLYGRTTYQGLAKRLVYQLKFAHARSAAQPIARCLAACLPPLGGAGWVVSYVPTATTRVRQRGYDQAALIARQLAARLRLPCIPLLGRLHQSRQVGATAADRRQQAAAAYRLRHAAILANRRVLLVDDVLTTGSTLQAAAAVLRAGGAAEVIGVVFARVISQLAEPQKAAIITSVKTACQRQPPAR